MALTRFLTIEATAAAQNTEADAEDPLVGIPRNSNSPCKSESVELVKKS